MNDDKNTFKILLGIYLVFVLVTTIDAYTISRNKILIGKNTTINPENLKPVYPEQIILNKDDINFLVNLDCKYESFGVQIGCNNAKDLILEHLKLKKSIFASHPSILSQDLKLKICYPDLGGYVSFYPNTTKIELVKYNTPINYHNITLAGNITHILFSSIGQRTDKINSSYYDEIKVYLK